MRDGLGLVWRTLFRRRVSMVGVVVAVGMATGLNAALFSIVDGLLLRPLPYRDADRIVHFDAPLSRFLNRPERIGPLNAAIQGLQLGDLTYVKERAVFEPGGSAFVEWGIRPVFVSPELFSLLGTRPWLGRAFVAADAMEQPRPVILSHGLWQSRFNADYEVVGNAITIPGALEDPVWTVVGVMPKEFSFPPGANLWLPYNEREFLTSVVPDFGRLLEPATLASVQAALPDVHVVPLRDYVRPDGAGGVALLLINTVLLLSVAWVQMAAMTYARTVDRATEFGIRRALGASPRQLAAEVVLEGAAFGLIALAIAAMCTRPLTTGIVSLLPAEMVAGQTLTPSWRVLVFSSAIQAGFLILWLLAGSETLGRTSDLDVTRSGGIGEAPRRALRLRFGLCAVQVGAVTALVFLATASLISLRAQVKIDIGFEPDQLIALRIPPPSAPRGTPVQERREREARHARLALESRARIVQSGEVVAASFASYWPMAAVQERRTIAVDPATSETIEVVPQTVGLDYMTTVGARLVSGRFPDADEVAVGFRPGSATRPVVVNRTLATLLDRRGPAVGQILQYSSQVRAVIVGVIENIEDDLLDSRVLPGIYSFLPQEGYGLVLLARLKASGSTASVRNLVDEVWGQTRENRQVVVMDDVVHRASTDSRARTILMTAVTLACLPLLTVGVIGAVAYAIGQRTRELAIRLALGAEQRQLQARVVSSALIGATVGIFAGLIVGTAAAAGIGEVASFAVPADHRVALISGISMLLLVAVPSLFAVRALRHVDPAALLRRT